jgi:flagellar biogenesis protein FliO
MLVTLFRILAGAGTVLLGAALVIAPVAAFSDRMTTVSALGIAGMLCLLAAWVVRRLARRPPPGDDPPGSR